MGKKSNLPDLSKVDLLTPISIESIGTNGDPCFGKEYNLSTPECKACGDSELCAIVLSGNLNKTREQLNEENHYKDLDVLIDISGVKKMVRSLKRKGLSKKEILDKVQNKFSISRQDARKLYRETINSK